MDENERRNNNEHLTRAQYRRQMRWGHHRQQKAKPVEAGDGPSREQMRQEEELIRRAQPDSAVTANDDEATAGQSSVTDDQGPVTTSRAASLAHDKQALAEQKSQHLAKKLNIVIAILVALIVMVYLILFFVG